MARKRDVVIAVIVGISSLIAIGFFGLIFIGVFLSDDGVSFGGFGEKIAVIDVYGTISESEETIDELKKWGESPGVKAIVIHVNSPGGAVAPSQEIYNEILRIREQEGKIVIVSMLNVAASGGYLISCAADKVMANPGTITGSIGVILQYPTAGELFKKVGVSYQTIKSGELKDVGALDRPITENERNMLTAMVMDTYEQFVDVVVEGRGLDREDVYDLADGSIFSGAQAYELGLVDTLGGFEDAIRYAADLAGIEGEPTIIETYKRKGGFLDMLGSLMGKVEKISTGDFGGPRVMYLY
ncbi:MAG: signal peptide peptidase SppA [Candidatus Zixiibacteriota bacterium]